MKPFHNLRSLLPVLSDSMRKGSCGRIGVVGGSKEYTGAPYFAAISALKLGADLVHVFCPSEAAPAIKGYSPELMVHPGCLNDDESLLSGLSRVDALVLGPGLGRDPKSRSLVQTVLSFARDKQIPTVIDADGLWFLCDLLDEFKGQQMFYLTPNIMEMHRLVAAAGIRSEIEDYKDPDHVISQLKLLSKAIGMAIYVKGHHDLVLPSSSEAPVARLYEEGMPRRCGGQGDLTAGTLAVLFFWATRIKEQSLSWAQSTAGKASHELVRELARRAFEKNGRATTTTDLIEQFAPTLFQADYLQEIS